MDETTKEEVELHTEVITEGGQKAMKMNPNHDNFLIPQRLDGETDYQYKARKMINKLYIKNKKKGTMIWVSKDIRQPVKNEAGEITGFQVTKGFTYNKKQVQAAVDAYIKNKEAQEQLKKLEETNQITIK